MVSWLLTGAPEQRYWQNREIANVGLDRRISNWASPRTSALKPRLSVSSHNTDARQTIERLTLSSYSACVNTENLVIKPGSAQIDVNFVNLKFVYSSVGRAPARQSGGRRFKTRSSQFFFVHPNLHKIILYYCSYWSTEGGIICCPWNTNVLVIITYHHHFTLHLKLGPRYTAIKTILFKIRCRKMYFRNKPFLRPKSFKP